jgi:hypothetical protein
MSEKTFNGVTAGDWERLRSGLAGFGIKTTGAEDEVVEGPMGVRMRVRYDGATKKLVLSIVKKPKFITEKQIWKVIESTAGSLRPAENEA